MRSRGCGDERRGENLALRSYVRARCPNNSCAHHTRVVMPDVKNADKDITLVPAECFGSLLVGAATLCDSLSVSLCVCPCPPPPSVVCAH